MKQSSDFADLKPHVEKSLADGRHRYCALENCATEPGIFGWKSGDQRFLLLSMRDGSPFPFRKTSLYGRSCNNVPGLVFFEVLNFGHYEEHPYLRKTLRLRLCLFVRRYLRQRNC